MTCATCRHAKQIGYVLCCQHPKESHRDIGLRAAVLVWRDRCGGKGYETRSKN
jgi:hypothetical protein